MHLNLSKLFGSRSTLTDTKTKVDFDFHKMPFEKLIQAFNTSLTQGIDSSFAKELLLNNGKNLIKPVEKNIFLKLFSYLFTGFCGLLWISSLICFLAWKPIGSYN